MTPLTNVQKQRNRHQQLDELAAEVGYKSWRQLETAAINGEVTITMEVEPTMDAKVTTKRIDSRNSEMVLRAGAKGRGKELFSVTFWPDSYSSVEEAERMMSDYASRNGYKIHRDEE